MVEDAARHAPGDLPQGRRHPRVAQDEIVSLLARETGSTFGFAMFQAHVFVPGLLRQAAALAYASLGQVIPSDTGAFSMGLRRPVGVVGAIAPWNAALILSARSIAAPLALGNTVVLKPSELSPVVGGLIWGEIFTEAGLPPGVLNIVTHAPGEAGPIGDELVENPHVRKLNFTGSTGTGRKLAEAAGRNLKPILLELGGLNPLIVLADADLEYAVNATAFGAFLHQGQICMSARKIIVEEPVKLSFRTCGFSSSSSPIGPASPGACVTMFRTPGGRPASVKISPQISPPTTGESSDGFRTTVFPRANGAAIERAERISAEFRSRSRRRRRPASAAPSRRAGVGRDHLAERCVCEGRRLPEQAGHEDVRLEHREAEGCRAARERRDDLIRATRGCRRP